MSDAFQSSSVVFGQRLRQARTVLGLPQDKLGVKAGLDESSASARMSRYESGLHMPDLPFAQRLAFELDVPDAYLFALDNTLADLILCYGKLTAAKRLALLESARFLCE